MPIEKSSRIPQFYKRTVQERQDYLRTWIGLTEEDGLSLHNELSLDKANNMIENVVGEFNLPLGIATNFLINGKDYLIPMVIEEPSVVAAASNAARLFRDGGGFVASSDESIMIGQLQILDVPNIDKAIETIKIRKEELLHEVNTLAGTAVRLGGGARDILTRVINESSVGTMLILHLHYDTRDAMGANMINTALEFLAPKIESITGGRINLRILSNLADQRKAKAEGIIPAKSLERGELSGDEVVKAILEAAEFARVDPHRAATHNKGIMNGIDPIIIATGNDWRAVEAGAHAYAARNGQYTSLTKWWQDDNDNLRGSIEMPMALGIVGGATHVHPTAQLSLEILDVKSSQELAQIIVTVGLAQNLAAMLALATDGIQKGHMRLHAKQLAVAAGASSNYVAKIAQQMIAEKNIRLERAKQLVQKIEGR